MQGTRANRGSVTEHPLFVFALLFTVLWVLHAPLLRLPYFWDEAGYFVPAARDLLLTGDPIAKTTLSNAHPPLVMAWLALWWKLSNYSAAVTRTSMLLVSAFGLLGLWRIARHIANQQVALATVALTAVYPVFFAQSSMAQLDVPVMALMLWTIALHLEDRRPLSIVCASLGALAKETALIVPFTIFGWEIICHIGARVKPDWAARWCVHCKPLKKVFALLLSAVPIALWYAYHYHRTGFLFGNPEYLRYNVGATVHPLRIAIAFIMRMWHTVGYMNLFVLTAIAAVALREPVQSDSGQLREGIDRRIQVLLVLIILAHTVAFSIVGGAALPRYLIPVIPLVILLCVSVLYRRMPFWGAWVAVVGAAFVMALLINPPWRIAPEDNLAYTDFVRLHKSAATWLEQKRPDSIVLTAWPASDELNRPFLGYVKKPMTVVRIENFTAPQVLSAAQQREDFDDAFVFSTKYEPPRNLLSRFGWWNRIQERFFDYHRDLQPDQTAMLLGGKIVWQQRRGGQWAAIIEIPKAKNARLKLPANGSGTTN